MLPASDALCVKIRDQLFDNVKIQNANTTSLKAKESLDSAPVRGCPFRVIFDTLTETVIGEIQIIYRSPDVSATGEVGVQKCGLGYAVLLDRQGKGIMTAAIGCVLES